MRSVRVAHLTSVHDAFDVRIVRKECRTLVEAGYDVNLVVCHPRNELMDGVKVHAIPRQQGRLRRMTLTVKDVYREAVELDADIYHFHDPELIPVCIGLKLRGKSVIYDVHEDVPKQIRAKPWIPAMLRPILADAAAIAGGVAGRLFDAIVAATTSIARTFPADSTITVCNFPILGELDVREPTSYTDRRAVIAYVGGITAIRGIKEMVEAAALVPEHFDLRLRVAGEMSPPQLLTEVQQLPGWGRTEFLRQLSRSEVARVLCSSRAGLVLFHPSPNHLEAGPTKLFEYMSVGLPVIASDFPAWREFIENSGCGLVVDPLNPGAIAEAITWMLEHPQDAEEMGRRGREAILTRCNWSVEGEKLLALYRRLENGLNAA